MHRAIENQHLEVYAWVVSKKKWDTKEDKDKSMMRALYVLWYAKRHVSGRSNVEQQKNQAHSLSRYRVTLACRHQAGSQ